MNFKHVCIFIFVAHNGFGMEQAPKPPKLPKQRPEHLVFEKLPPLDLPESIIPAGLFHVKCEKSTVKSTPPAPTNKSFILKFIEKKLM